MNAIETFCAQQNGAEHRGFGIQIARRNATGDRLKLRVFPDEIFVNRHEGALTLEEQAAGKKYYDDLNRDGNELARWREIIQRFGPERSAYILRALRPTEPYKGKGIKYEGEYVRRKAGKTGV